MTGAKRTTARNSRGRGRDRAWDMKAVMVANMPNVLRARRRLTKNRSAAILNAGPFVVAVVRFC